MNYLSKKGYVINKNNITVDELKNLKLELRAKPLIDNKFNFKIINPYFPVYTETKNKIYVPKMYGIEKFGFPKHVLDNYEGKQWQNDIIFNGTLLDRQIEPVNALIKACEEKGGGILDLQTGFGKCHKIDTPILMFDGSIKKVQDIIKGDLLMGDDSSKRTVLSLASGNDIMYDIISSNGEKYTVNQCHILCFKVFFKPLIKSFLKCNNKIYYVKWFENNKFNFKIFKEKNNITLFLKKINCQNTMEISVNEYLKLSKSIKSILRGYKVPINFSNKSLVSDPYTIGFFLNNKKISQFIPMIYKCNSTENRLKLLAGLLDSNGYLCNIKNSFEIVEKSEQLIDDIMYLSRSLGFLCNKKKHKNMFQISIYGEIYKIPTLHKSPINLHNKNVLEKEVNIHILSTKIKIIKVGYDNYYGFQIDGNNKYVMGDFTVTHNTFCALYALSKLKGKTIIVVNKIPLMNQWVQEAKNFLPNANIGIIQGQKNIADTESCDIIVIMLQSLSRIDYPDSLFKDIQILIVDECHNLGSNMFSQVLFKLTSKYTIGLSATPKRADGCEYIFKWHIGDIVYKSNEKRIGKPPIIRCLKINTEEYKEISIINSYTGLKQIQFTSMLSELIKIPKRNLLVVELLKNLTLQNRKILVIGDRREHLEIINDLLNKDISIIFTYGLFLGQKSKKDEKRNEITRNCQVILATFSCFKEGVSEKDLDTLIIITPKKYIDESKITNKDAKKDGGSMTQLVGRIFRKDHIVNNPLIIDFFDNFSVYKNQFRTRNIFYKKHFENGIFEDQSIDLDEHIDIQLSYIKTKKTKICNQTENSNQITQFITNCIID